MLPPRPLVRSGPPWVVDEVRAAAAALTGEAEPTVARLLAVGESGVRVEGLRREIERAGEGLPVAFGPVRRTRLLAWDARSTTWEAWNTLTGERLLLRAPRPTSRADARMLAGWAKVPGATLRHDGGTRLESQPLRATLGDLLPLEETADPAWRAGVLGGVLGALAGLDGPHGLVHPDLVALVGDDAESARWTLVWLGPPEPAPRRATDDLRDVGEIALLLDDPVVGGFAEDPPPSPIDALDLFLQGLTEELLAARHALLRRSRTHARSGRVARLRTLVARLEAAQPPPRGRGCVRAGTDGVVHLVESDGRQVRAGAAQGPIFGNLPELWRDGRLDAAGARALLRAWRGRTLGDEARRARTDAELGGGAAPLMRWVNAMLRLRTDRLLLDVTARD